MITQYTTLTRHLSNHPHHSCLCIASVSGVDTENLRIDVFSISFHSFYKTHLSFSLFSFLENPPGHIWHARCMLFKQACWLGWGASKEHFRKNGWKQRWTINTRWISQRMFTGWGTFQDARAINYLLSTCLCDDEDTSEWIRVRQTLQRCPLDFKITQTQDFRWSCRNNKKISKHYHDKLWIHIWRMKIYHKHTERKSHTEFQVSFKTKLQNKRINEKSQQCYKIKFSPLVYKILSISISMM